MTGALRVSFALVHHDLIALRHSERLVGLYWLRLFHGRRWIAVVTEVPGNPGLSSSNAMDEIVLHLRDQFGVQLDLLRLFEVWPRGSPAGAGRTRVHEIVVTPELRWVRSSHAAVARLIGRPLPKLPDHAPLYGQALALGGGNFEEQLRERFEPLDVGALPPPHNPSRCAFHLRFLEVARNTPDAERLWDAARLAGAAFIRSLTPADRLRCPYHGANWRRIADESVRIIEALGPRDSAEYARAAARSRLPTRERDWLIRLFEDPVFVTESAFTNGQHRGCALRFSGAARAAIVTGYDRLGTICTDWTYTGGG
jgi:hypothetical protein